MADKIKLDQNTSLKDIKWGGLINECLWTFAGVDKKLLRQCPSEYAKYAGMGGTILCTAIMAMISGAYAIYFVFESSYIACAFGVFWGILILNLDRFIVSTMYSDGKHTISKLELWSGLPRIIMAIFLGIVISTPLEMKLFEERIDIQISEIQSDRSRQFVSSNNDYLEELKNNKKILSQEKKRRQENLEQWRNELVAEAEGRSRSGKAGIGPAYRAKEDNKDAAQKDIDKIESEEKILDEKIAKIEAEINVEKKKYDEIASENGFCQRYEAFSKIDDNNLELTIVIWFIRLLFIIIEVAPVFFRMMVAAGPYDELLQAQKLYISKLANRESFDIQKEYETEIAISTERNRIRLEAENMANEALYRGIADAQSQVISTAIEKWKQQELEKVEKDPSAYIKIN